MDHAPGWRTDPENEAEERYWDGCTWTDLVRPAGKAIVMHLPEHVPELQRALAAATADIDEVEDRLSTLFDRTEKSGWQRRNRSHPKSSRNATSCEVDRTWVNPTTDDPGDDFDVELYLDFEVEAFADGDESGDFSTKGGSHADSAAATMPFRADEMDLDFAELDAASGRRSGSTPRERCEGCRARRTASLDLCPQGSVPPPLLIRLHHLDLTSAGVVSP